MRERDRERQNKIRNGNKGGIWFVVEWREMDVVALLSLKQKNQSA